MVRSGIQLSAKFKSSAQCIAVSDDNVIVRTSIYKFEKRLRLVEPDFLLLNVKLAKLVNAVRAERSKAYCLSIWSDFVRTRDGFRCVDCHSTDRLSAHHIFRKVLAPPAQFDPGNGITLCKECHKICHAGFNRRPDLSLPVDAEGGEKLDSMERLYAILYQDSVERGLVYEPFYSISEIVISTLKKMQGYSVGDCFPGSTLQQACIILATCERQTRDALLTANGFAVEDAPFLPGIVCARTV